MKFQLRIIPRILTFKRPATTSRGSYTERKVWYLKLSSPEFPGRVGLGECAPLPALSIDDLPDYESVLQKICIDVEKTGSWDEEKLRSYPSILFGLETAFRHWHTGTIALWDTPFSRGERGIPINGLIWMADYDDMYEQIKAKIIAGYRCIKLKIGAIDFEEELSLLRYIRSKFSPEEIELRVDANGAFSPSDALQKLEKLAALDLHSIEQPIRAGQWKELRKITASSLLPVALDEELIGNYTYVEKQHLLEAIAPQYLILKPSLHGGIVGCREWIQLAEQKNIGWWVTSALESNVGLNAIAQWCATYDNPMPQGLGTGLLYNENEPMPIYIEKDCLWYHPE